jgi:hypothetical protein
LPYKQHLGGIVEKKQLFVLFFQIILDNAIKHGYYSFIVIFLNSKRVLEIQQLNILNGE